MLEAIIAFIQSHLDEVCNDQNTQRNDRNKIFLGVLETIIKLLKESNQFRHVDKIFSALEFIESIPIQGFFSNTPLGKLLKDDGFPTVQNEFNKCPLDIPLSGKEQSILGSIHINIRKKICWSYKYQLNKNGEILNEEIAHWQNGHIKIRDGSAYVDYKRDFTLMDESGSDQKDEVIDRMLDRLVSKATAYSQHEKLLIRAWLETNGGQDNNRFLEFLAMNCHFTSDPMGQGPTIGCSEGIVQNWQTNARGKIEFEYKAFIKMFAYGTDKFIVHGPKGEQIVTEIDESMSVAFADSKKLNPLMHVHAKIELDVRSNNVIPKITLIHATSFTKLLRSPEYRVIPKNNVYSPTHFQSKSQIKSTASSKNMQPELSRTEKAISTRGTI